MTTAEPVQETAVTAKFCRLLYNKDGYTVVSYRAKPGTYDDKGFALGKFIAVGQMLPCQDDAEVTLYGSWFTRRNKLGEKESQLKVSRFDAPLPKNKKGICAFLEQKIDGCGAKTAELIYTKWGETAFAVLSKISL